MVLPNAQGSELMWEPTDELENGVLSFDITGHLSCKRERQSPVWKYLNGKKQKSFTVKGVGPRPDAWVWILLPPATSTRRASANAPGQKCGWGSGESKEADTAGVEWTDTAGELQDLKPRTSPRRGTYRDSMGNASPTCGWSWATRVRVSWSYCRTLKSIIRALTSSLRW